MVFTPVEVVRIKFEAVSRGFAPVVNRVKKGMDGLRLNVRSMNHVFGQNLENWKKQMVVTQGNTPLLARFANKVRMVTHGLRGFRMEMLGVMFFGMGMQRLFTRLLKPAAELVGMFDIWKVTLQVLFLPIMMDLLVYLLKFSQWIMNMPEETKRMISKFVIWGAVIGVLLFLFGTLMLGIGSMILAFSGLFVILDKLIPDISLFGVNLSSAIEAGLAVFGLVTLWKTLKTAIGLAYDKIMDTDLVKDALDKLGIKVDEGKTPWEQFKEIITESMREVATSMGLGEEFTKLETWISNTKKEMKKWLDDFRERLGFSKDDVGDLSDSITTMGFTIENITPSLKTMADALNTIAGAIKAIKSAWDTLTSASTWKYLKYAFSGGNTLDLVNYMAKQEKNKGSSGGGGLTEEEYEEYRRRGAEAKAKYDDFLWRPGQSPISINPNDTLIGFKGNNPMGGSVTVNQTVNVTASNKDEIDRLIASNNSRLVEDIKRMVSTG